MGRLRHKVTEYDTKYGRQLQAKILYYINDNAIMNEVISLLTTAWKVMVYLVPCFFSWVKTVKAQMSQSGVPEDLRDTHK